MITLQGMISAPSASVTSDRSDTFRGLEDARVVCHVKTLSHPAKKVRDSPLAPQSASGCLSVKVDDVEEATCQLCHLGHKTQHKDLGKVLTFSMGTSSITMHHLCGTLALRGDHATMNMEDLKDALEEARMRCCRVCSEPGAFIRCCYGDCLRWYHLNCSMNATDVVVDTASGQLFCPKHTVPDSDDSHEIDAEFGQKQKKHRSSNPLKISGQKRRKQPHSVQRPRTDWQRRGPNSWVKVVPPWWAEQKTIHFANKVFRELFMSNLEVDILDSQGITWKCEVMKETRNDLRLQFTLMGQFQELWAHAGIKPGDILSFEKMVSGAEFSTHMIQMAVNAPGVESPEPLASKPRKKSGARSQSTRGTTAVSSAPSQRSKIITEETPWSFIQENIATKVVHPNNLAKTKCPITGELLSKITGNDSKGSTFAVYDPNLKKHFVFEIQGEQKTSESYIYGSGFLAWMIESAVRPGDSIQLESTDTAAGILISKVSSAACPRRNSQGALSSASSSNTSMITLAAAACYCHTHGTPGIKALLDLPSCESPV
jgi:hypothetical protein